MVFDWQTVISLVIVAAAAAWILRQMLATGQGDSSCGSCGNCSSNSVNAEPQNERATPQRVYQLTGSQTGDTD